MSTIIPIAKYNEETKTFSATIEDFQRGTSLSIIKNKFIYDENNDHFDYIIFANGNRVKDITKDGIHPYPERDYTERIKRYFAKQNKNVIIEHILLDNDSPLNIEAEIVARYVDYLSTDETIDTINLIGHSKCGTLFFNVPKYFKKETSFTKTAIATTASPFTGCLIAAPKYFLKDVKTVIDNNLPAPINNIVYNAISKYYTSLHSGSHMDNDICIPFYNQEMYDPSFILKMFDLANINAIKRIRKYQNFITSIDNDTLMNSLRRGDFISVGMCLIDHFFISELTDGFVEVRSQEGVNEYLPNSSTRIESTTHYFLTHEEEMAIVLDFINNSIDEYKDQLEFIKRKNR